MLGLVGYEGDFDGAAGNSDRHSPPRNCAEWQRQNCYVTSLRAAGVCPERPWSEPDAPLDLGIIVNLFGIVEPNDSIESQPKTLSDITTELHTTGLLEQGREQSDTIAERQLIVGRMLDDALVSLAGGVQPVEQVLYSISQHMLLGAGCASPRRLVEDEPGGHGLRLRLDASTARSTCA